MMMSVRTTNPIVMNGTTSSAVFAIRRMPPEITMNKKTVAMAPVTYWEIPRLVRIRNYRSPELPHRPSIAEIILPLAVERPLFYYLHCSMIKTALRWSLTLSPLPLSLCMTRISRYMSAAGESWKETEPAAA